MPPVKWICNTDQNNLCQAGNILKNIKAPRQNKSTGTKRCGDDLYLFALNYWKKFALKLYPVTVYTVHRFLTTLMLLLSIFFLRRTVDHHFQSKPSTSTAQKF
mmetsp:Transcript_14535/g.32004  ORF Transcript_14535/g.32004 Transcript_14535/m.32004 type:complete len:103 (+) Transcript_14535:366-674(+)